MFLYLCNLFENRGRWFFTEIVNPCFGNINHCSANDPRNNIVIASREFRPSDLGRKGRTFLMGNGADLTY